MDRMDCQIVMISFCYVHYITFVDTDSQLNTIDYWLSKAAQMNLEDQRDLHKQVALCLAVSCLSLFDPIPPFLPPFPRPQLGDLIQNVTSGSGAAH